MSEPHLVFYEATPNPQAMKFNLGRQIGNETVFIDDPLKADRSPLAQRLFAFPWLSAVMIGPDFITVTKQDWVGWDVLADPLSDLIHEHLVSGDAFLKEVQAEEEDPHAPEIVRNIRRVLNQEIRPAVAMDGGDIVFNRYEDGVVFLELKGSCSGCPSSTMTLKQGIESRLRELFPEIREVVSVADAAD
jgi:Fe-S cluster biogenesis protein NfuA